MRPVRTQPTISGTTRIAGVVGDPIAHTLSPAMQNAAFAALGLDAVYVPFRVEPSGLGPLLRALSAAGALGLNVTVPYKQAVVRHLHGLAPSARRIGAVNTVVFSRGKCVGHNTDGTGCLASLTPVCPPRGQRAVLLGAGGAGRAVAVALCDAGCAHLTLVEPDAAALRRLTTWLSRLGHRRVTALAPGTAPVREALARARLVINATPLGLRPADPLPVPAAWLPARACVLDLVYGHGPTRFQRVAGRRGCRVVPGWHMLLHQGAEAFRLWTGRPAPLAVMRRALLLAGV